MKDSIFKGFNNKVEKHSFGINEVNQYNRVSNGSAARDYLNNKAILEHCNEIEESAKRSEKAFEDRQKLSKVTLKGLTESQSIIVLNKINDEGKTSLFKDIIYEMFNKSLILDEDFILENAQNIKALTDNYIDSNGGFKLLENAIKRSKSPFLQSVKKLCESTSIKVGKRKLKLIKEADSAVDDVNSLTFDLDDDEDTEFNYDKKELGIDDLSDLVKQKVLTVVQDEKQRETEQEELYSDIEDQIQNDDKVTTEEAAKEALSKIQIKQNPVEETTLFNALVRHSYKEVLENVAVNTNTNDAVEKDAKDASDYKVNTDEDDITIDEQKDFTTEDIKDSEYSLDDEMQDTDPDFDDGDDDEEEIDMDLVLTEAITKYTLMELAYTIQLESYSIDNVKKICQSLLK